MKKILKFETEFGDIYIEEIQNESLTNEMMDVSSSDRIIVHAKNKLESSISSVKSMISLFGKQINNIYDEVKPDEIEIKLGLKIDNKLVFRQFSFMCFC